MSCQIMKPLLSYFKPFLLLGFIGINCVFAQPVKIENPPVKQKFDQVMVASFDRNGPGGVLLVAKHGTVIYQNAIGKANVELDVPLSPANVFRVGSLTKQFTAVAILQLMEKGRLELNDDITKFIPDYPTHGNHVSIANLLSHTSGIKDYTDIKGLSPDIRRRKSTVTEIISLFKDEPMDFTPGAEFRYSNSNYILLGYIIEKLSGKSYEQYIKEHIFTPLDMSHAYYDSPEKTIPNRLTGYVQRQGDTVVNADYFDPSNAYAAGALVMTAEDLFKWHMGLYRYTILKKENLEKAFTPFKLNNGQLTKYGFGWELDSLSGSPAIQHSGSINGFSAYEIYLPKEDVFVVCLSNRMNISTGGPAAIAASIAADKPNVKEIQLSKAQMTAYIGFYKFKLDQPTKNQVFIKNGKLYLQQVGAPHPWEMHFTKSTEFYMYEVFPNNHVFAFDNAGKVTGFVIHAANYVSIITKVE